MFGFVQSYKDEEISKTCATGRVRFTTNRVKDI